MSKIKRFINRFMFAWHYAYETNKWRSFSKHNKLSDPTNNKEGDN